MWVFVMYLVCLLVFIALSAVSFTPWSAQRTPVTTHRRNLSDVADMPCISSFQVAFEIEKGKRLGAACSGKVVKS